MIFNLINHKHIHIVVIIYKIICCKDEYMQRSSNINVIYSLKEYSTSISPLI